MSLEGPLMPELAGRVADAFEDQVREQEERWLSPHAVRSYETRGRLRSEDDCRLRTPFQRDRDRILTHTGPQEPATLEGKIVRIVDRVAYINHDIDDAVRFGILDPAELPHEEVALLGDRGSRRIDTLVHDLVESSQRAGDIVQSEEIGGAMLALRAFMFERVYLGPHTRQEQERARATVRRIFEHLAERGDEPEQIVEFIAGMTDRFALSYVAGRS